MEQVFDVVVLGAGVSGLAAAKEASHLGLRTAVVESEMPGGLVVNINHLSPGIDGAGASGSELAAEMMMACMDAGVAHFMESANGIRKVGNAFEVVCSDSTLQSKGVVVATGAGFKKLDLHRETDFEGKGVSHCADCDGRLYKGKTAVVVGGGNSAVQEALILTEICSEVHLVYRDGELTADLEFTQQLTPRKNLISHAHSVPEEILGKQGVTGLKIRDLKTNELKSIDCAVVFPFIGLSPKSDFLPADLSRDALGAVVTDDSLQSSIQGIFVAGAVRAGYSGYIADALGEGRKAAQAAAAYLKACQ